MSTVFFSLFLIYNINRKFTLRKGADMNRIRQLREEYGRSQSELAKYLGITPQAVSGYENGKRNPPTDVCQRIADFFLVSTDYVLGRSDDPKRTEVRSDTVRIKVLGRVAAGIPFDAVEEIVDFEDIPATLAKTGEFFGLRIRGDSMSPRILNGDTVIVRKQDDADTGDIVIALINGSEGCCKRFKRFHGGISLISLNPVYEPLVYSEDEVKTLPVKIIGRVVELRGKL